jgi:hypothetical protein
VLVFFDGGRTALLPEWILLTVELPAQAPSSVWERSSNC